MLVDFVRKRNEIAEDITVVSIVEFPQILSYKKFTGRTVYHIPEDYELAYKLQLTLMKIGKPKPFSDLLVAAICINRNEELLTNDKDFEDITQISNLKLMTI
ncbi:MAG: DNA-binding protein [Aigarchaeota archaeon]|nr:DNA-binding protein [Candidatus Pelearchaeum maunauluense]